MSGSARRAAKPLSRAISVASKTQVTGQSGMGLVHATLSGDGRLVKLHVSPAIGKEGPKAIESHVSAAVNRAHDRLKELYHF